MLTKAPRQSNVKLVSHIDCPGGGQVWVEGTTLYVGHMRPTSGTTIIDVADPRSPRILSQIAVREGWHSHKVRVADDIMIVNQEKFGKSFAGRRRRRHRHLRRGEPGEPKLISEWRTVGGGVHRFDFDGRYAYISPTAEGLYRQHRDDPRPRRSGEADRGRPLVDSRSVAGRRRGISVERLGAAALPSSVAPRRSALRQLLAPRLLHSRHCRPVEAEADLARQHQPELSRIRPTPAW